MPFPDPEIASGVSEGYIILLTLRSSLGFTFLCSQWSRHRPLVRLLAAVVVMVPPCVPNVNTLPLAVNMCVALSWILSSLPQLIFFQLLSRQGSGAGVFNSLQSLRRKATANTPCSPIARRSYEYGRTGELSPLDWLSLLTHCGLVQYGLTFFGCTCPFAHKQSLGHCHSPSCTQSSDHSWPFGSAHCSYTQQGRRYGT